jgi:hypothetical protein
MTRLKSLAIGSAAAAVMMAGAVSQSFALEPGSFDNRLNGGTIGIPLGASAPAGVYTGLGTLYTPAFYGNGYRAGSPGPSGGVPGLAFPSIGQAVPVLWSTGLNFLGAAYSVSVVQAFYAAGTLPIGSAGALQGSTGSSWNAMIANTIWNPVALSWNLGGGWFASVGFNFMAPDGSTYGPGQTNPDYWTFEPTFAFAYLANNWAISANFFYDINTASKGRCCGFGPNGGLPISNNGLVGFTGGNELYLDWAALYSIGKWQFGPVGYAKVQTTSDSYGGQLSNGAVIPALSCAGPANTTQCSRNSAVALGGLVGYNFGPVDIQVWVTDAVYQKNDINGFAVWNRLSFRVWGPDAPKPLVSKN